jgi:hypothetical protein
MAMAATLNKRSKTSAVYFCKFTLVASGNYATNGDTVDFAPKAGFTNRQPDYVDINGIAGFIYTYDRANKKVLVFGPVTAGANTALGQVSAGAYPAGITGDTIDVLAIWFATPGLTR